MKNTAAAILGATLVLGGSTAAQAASQVDVSGFFRNFYITDHNYMRDYTDFKDADSYFISRLDVNVVFRPTDEMSIHWRLRAPDMYRWGAGGTSEAETKFIYGQIQQDWGTIRVGRLDAPDQMGLTSLGYIPTSVDFWMTRLGPFDSSTDRDSLWYQQTWDNGFGLTAYYTMLNSQRGVRDSTPPPKWDSDGANHRFIIEPRYKWDGGGAALGLAYNLNHLQNFTYQQANDNRNYLKNKSGKIWSANPALRLNWGDFSLNFEGKAAWGKQYRAEWARDSAGGFVSRPEGKNESATGLALYLNGDYNYGPGNVILSGWWAAGNDLVEGGAEDPTRYNGQKNRALVDMNDNFYPFVVAYASENRFGGRDGHYSAYDNRGGNAIWWANTGLVSQINAVYKSQALDAYRLPGSVQTAAHTNDKANNWGVSLHGNHTFTPEISMSYALGYMGLVNPNYKMGTYFTSDGTAYNPGDKAKGGQWTNYQTQSKDLGWEVDLGLRFKLLDNLTFATTFGYMFNGDAYKSLAGFKALPSSASGADPTNNQDYAAVWRKPGDTYSWINTLNFEF